MSAKIEILVLKLVWKSTFLRYLLLQEEFYGYLKFYLEFYKILIVNYLAYKLAS